ncbi:MAG: SEC-C metal-binding domain-containing protein [Anaerostipes hadrus]
METIGRNDACWCGSGKKYKKCHCHFDEKLKELQQEGHIIPSHDMIKTPEQIEKIKERKNQYCSFGLRCRTY